MGLVHNYNKQLHDVYLYEDEGPQNIFSTHIIPEIGQQWNIPYKPLSSNYGQPVFFWDRDLTCPDQFPQNCGIVGNKSQASPIAFNPDCIAFTEPINGITPDFSGRDAPERGAGRNIGEHPLHNIRGRYGWGVNPYSDWPTITNYPEAKLFKNLPSLIDPNNPNAGWTWEFVQRTDGEFYNDVMNIHNWNNGHPPWFIISKKHILGCGHFIGYIPIKERRTLTVRWIGKNNQTYYKKIRPRSTENIPNIMADYVVYEFVDDSDNPIELTSDEQVQIKQYKIIDPFTIPAGVGLYKVNPSGTFAGLKTPAPWISGIDLSTNNRVWNDSDFTTNIDQSQLEDSSYWCGFTYNTQLQPNYPIYPEITFYNDQKYIKKCAWREPRGVVWLGHSGTDSTSFITTQQDTYILLENNTNNLDEWNSLKSWLESIFTEDNISDRFFNDSYQLKYYATGYDMPLEKSPYKSRFRNPTIYTNPIDYTFNNELPESINPNWSQIKPYQNIIWHGFLGGGSLQSQELNEMQESIINQSSRYSNMTGNWLEVRAGDNKILNGVGGGFISEFDYLVPLWPEYFEINTNPLQNYSGWYLTKDLYGFYYYSYIRNISEIIEQLEHFYQEMNPSQEIIVDYCDYRDQSFQNRLNCLWNTIKYLIGSGTETRYKNLRDSPSNETLDINGSHRIYSIQNINYLTT